MKVDSRIRQRNFGYSSRTRSSGRRATCGAGCSSLLSRFMHTHQYVVQYTITRFQGQSAQRTSAQRNATWQRPPNREKTALSSRSRLRLLGHRETAGLGFDAADRNYHWLHAQGGGGGDGEIDLRDAHQADGNSGEGNGGGQATHGDGDGQLRAWQFGGGGARGRARAGNQERGGVAIAGDVGGRGLALPGGGRWSERSIGGGEQAGGRGRHREGEARHLPVVVHAQYRQAASGLIGNLHVDLSGGHVTERGADAVDGGRNSGEAERQRQHAGGGGGGRQLRAEHRHQRAGRECLGVRRSVGDGRDDGGLRRAHDKGDGDVDGLRNGVVGLHGDQPRVGAAREAGGVYGDVQGSGAGSGKRADG